MDDHTLTAVVHDVTAEGADMEISGQHVTLPSSVLPEGVRRGDRVVLRVMTESEAAADQAERARAILAEILGSRS